MIKRCPQHGFFRGEHCECGLAGQLILDEAKTEQLGRLVAGASDIFPAIWAWRWTPEAGSTSQSWERWFRNRHRLGQQRTGNRPCPIRSQAEI